MRALVTALLAIALLLALVSWLIRDRGGVVVPVQPGSDVFAPGDPHEIGVRTPAGPAVAQSVAPSAAHRGANRREAVRSTTGSRCRVFGRVVDEQRAPIVGADVRLVAMSGRWSTADAVEDAKLARGGNDSFETRTDADGRFFIGAPVPISVHVALVVTPDPHHAIFEREFGPGGPRNQPPLVAGDNELGDIVVALAGAVEGRVVDELGVPIPRPMVWLQKNQGTSYGSPGDEQGHFVLGHVPQGAHMFTVKAHGWLRRVDIPVEIEPGRTRNLPDVVLARAPTLSGVVVDATGAAVREAQIRATPVQSGMGALASSNPDGTFVLYLQATGAHTLEVRGSKELTVWSGARGESFEPGRSDVRAVLEPLPRMRFRVVDARTQQPVGKFDIGFDPVLQGRILPARDIVAVDHPGGVAELPLLQGATHVTVEARGYAPVHVEVVPGPIGTSAVQTLLLSPASSIQGRVVRGGVPVARARVLALLESMGPPKPPVRGATTSDTIQALDFGELVARRPKVESGDDGTFLIGDLPSGSFTLQIDVPGMAETSIRGLPVRAQDMLDVGDVELPLEAIVRGKVITGAGESPADIDVQIDRRSGGKRMRAMLDGSFEFTALGAGPHSLTWRRESDRSPLHLDGERAQQIDLAAGETREIVLDVRDTTPARVVVRVLRHGEPLSNVTVAAIRRDRRPDAPRTMHLGITGPDGVCEGLVEGGVRFDLVALGQAGRVIGVGGSDLLAEVGGRIDNTILVSLGSLRIILGSSIPIPEQGGVGLLLKPFRGEPRTWRATTEKYPNRSRADALWSGYEVRVDDLCSGVYEATVSADRWDPDPDQPGKMKRTIVLDGPTVRFMIAEDRVTTIGVP